ncbi:MAG: lytic murein transglycosylase B [Candidatus Dactylopiibacterium carminicum]|uniref:Lytic murein transglycosylase B n=1 Tax=Candidatus Dactylopiibacterium carminicum TaxID=857335 RepID=A0A272ERX2_9RHOO|nr:lytic murein transglycosylase B [Candidatus Dactylopiibacterium carminicum]KAF7598956.1 lytic murein transglycosylase B [Candidatus Dactylopiibacterium carminicum]PAS92858.1 MAG: lytic murein transglycosylase B [Candidatus Dactylopiibacterium carminicum]PAS98972.1 MAG: lytic murein transglycosylase B [Candidatus Dactylopiibacterium carminicum]
MSLRRSLLLTLAAIPAVFSTLPAHAQGFIERPDVQAFITEIAARNRFTEGELYAAFARATPQPRVIELIRPPSNPGVRSWQRYRTRFIEPIRISAGAKFWQENREALAQASQRTGVPAEIIVGIIGVETIYGRYTGNFNTLSALATLAFDYPPRADLFRRELESLFLLAREQGRDVTGYTGSYAGALGLPQFLPSSVRNFAMDGDGNGKVDLDGSPRDAIFLQQHGWQSGTPIVRQARVADAAKAQRLADAGIEPAIDVSILGEYGIEAELPASALGQKITLVDLVTPGEATEWWLGFQNFYVITRYNRSSFYAMAVHDLAQAVKQEVDNRSAQAGK